MKCDKCKEKEATFFLEESVNGKKSALHLCSDCAKEAGLIGNAKSSLGEDPFSLFFPTGYPDLLGDILGMTETKPAKGKVCPSCGATFGDLAATGKVSCAACYTTFARELEDSIRKIHGNVTHTGRAPSAHRESREKAERAARLRADLKSAIDSENYEEAARLRDEIRGIDA